ncbi:MAG TPA: DUF4097 family beta strand repeat-containing protein, partial [Opitutaceae bacterium]
MSSLVRISLLALALTVGLRASDETTTNIKFSDPSKPGTLKLSLGRGDLVVQGEDTPEVTIRTNARASGSTVRKDGLRVISSAASFGLSEKDNVVTIDATADMTGWKGGAEFKIKVPKNTAVVVQNSWGGDITCSGLNGDIDVKSMQGEIKLNDVGGAVLVETMNGKISASLAELREGKPLSFTSWNGEVILRLPQQAKATVRLRTQNGSVLTDFDEAALVTKAEAAVNPPSTSRSRVSFSRDGKVLTAEVQESIREAVAMGASAAQEALEAVKAGLEEAKLSSEEARRAMDRARRDMDKARQQAERARAEAERTHVHVEAPPAPPAPAASPKPVAVPVAPRMPKMTISGGKLV